MTAPQAPTADVGDLIETLRAKAIEQGDSPEPFLRGTFAMYAMPDGGVMVVSAVTDEGPMQGVHHHRMPPTLIHAFAALMGGGPLAAIKGWAGKRRRRKEIEGV